MKLLSSSKKTLFTRTKMTIAMSLLLGSTGAFMLSSAPLMADSTTGVKTGLPITVAGTLPELKTLIKQNRSAVVSISVVQNDVNQINQKRYRDQLKRLPKEFGDLFKNMPQGPHGFQFGQKHKSQAQGSGFIIAKDGYIITNTHVVDNAHKITVRLADKRQFQAKLIGSDKLSDIALLKIEAKDLPSVEFGNSDNLDVGEWVVAIGTPFGLDFTATQGIISALSRSLPSETYVPFIQTDAAVNPGSSGGPLFNLKGQVIGVNSQIYSRSGGYMGVSFAIPINIVKNVTEQLKTDGKVSRGWLGVAIQNVDENLAKSFGIPKAEGSLVSSVVPDSPAAKAGFQAGDVIVRFDDKAVRSAQDLPLLVGNTPIGKDVAITIVRSGSEKVLDVTIQKLGGKNEEPVLASLSKGSLGVAVSTLTANERVKLKIKKNGVKVEKVLSDSPAENAGLQTGDIILSVNGNNIDSPSSLKNIIQKSEGDKPLAILLQRGDMSLFVAVKIES